MAQPSLRVSVIGTGSDAETALADADLVLLLTEWKQFRAMDPRVVASLVAKRNIIDGRNVLDAAAWRAAGWNYRGIGRP